MHRIVFSIVVSQRKLLVQLVSASTKLRQMFYAQIERRLFAPKADIGQSTDVSKCHQRTKL